jgi:hypothetical protein
VDVPWLVVPGLALQLVTRPAPSNASWCIDGQTFHIPESDMEIYKWKPVVVLVCVCEREREGGGQVIDVGDHGQGPSIFFVHFTR